MITPAKVTPAYPAFFDSKTIGSWIDSPSDTAICLSCSARFLDLVMMTPRFIAAWITIFNVLPDLISVQEVQRNELKSVKDIRIKNTKPNIFFFCLESCKIFIPVLYLIYQLFFTHIIVIFV